MLVSQVHFYEEKHAFHLYLHVPDRGYNTLVSTIPQELLNKHFPSTFATLKYGYFVNTFSADNYLTLLSDKILAKKDLHKYFYPHYLLVNGRATFDTAESLIKLIDNFPIYSRTHYCMSNCPILFWVLTIKYIRMKRNILKTGVQINRSSFEDYLLNSIMTSDYEQIREESDIYLTLSEYERIEYVLVIGQQQELKFFISI